MKRRPHALAERKPLTLAYFGTERPVPAGSLWWRQIAVWQSEGLVRLVWGETRDFANVVLTDAGKVRVAGVKV